MQGPAARTPQPPAAYQPPAAQRTPQHPPPQHPQQQQAHPAPQPWPPLSSQPPAAQQPHPGYAQPAFTAGSTPGSSGAAPPTIRALFGGPTLSTAAPVSASTPAAPAMHQLQRPAPLPPLFQQSQRFSFQPPPGLVPSSDEEVAQQELAPQAPLYQATPPQGWAPANPAAPTVQAVPASTAFGGGGQRAPAPPAAAPRPAPRAGAGGKAGSGKRGGKPGTGSSNIVWSFDPTPQPVKPTVQVTLQEAVSRHAKAAAEKRQQPQQQHQPEAGAEQAAQAHQPAPSQARSLGLPPLPPALQGAGRATPAKPAAEPWLPTQPVFAAPSPFQPAGPAQHEATAPAAPLLSAGVQAPRRPPLPRGRFKEPAEGARGSAWAPAASAAGASSTRGQPASAEACRARLQHLLCADADPFAAAAASTGRWVGATGAACCLPDWCTRAALECPLFSRPLLVPPPRRWEWLREPRDSAGRPPSHPDHDPTTLLIPASAWGADLKGADAQCAGRRLRWLGWRSHRPAAHAGWPRRRLLPNVELTCCQTCPAVPLPVCRYWRIKADGCAHTVMFFQEG